MVFSFVFVEITGDSYADFSRRLTRQPEVATILGFSRVPDESAFSRAWRNRFDNAVHEYIHAAAHFVIKEVHDRDISAPEVRPKSEILNDTEEAADSVEDESFSQEEIVQTTRLARDHAFGHFDSGRASNASYEDTQFFELQTFMGWFGGAEPRRELLAFSTGVARTTAHMAIPTFALSSSSILTSLSTASTRQRIACFP